MNSAEELMRNVLESWGKADVRPFLDALDENIVWRSADTTGAATGRRFGGRYDGRAGILEHLSQLSTTYFFESCEAKEIISRGEIVWGLFVVRGSYAPNGPKGVRKPFAFDTAYRFRVRDGKILEGQAFYDTAALVSLQCEGAVA